MERLKYWFGGRHSIINQHYSDLANDSKGDTEKHISNKNKDLAKVENHYNEKQELSIKTEKTHKGNDDTAAKRNVTRNLIPLKEGDCLSCKLIAVGCLMSISFMALYTHVISRGKYHGTKKIFMTTLDFGIIGGKLFSCVSFIVMEFINVIPVTVTITRPQWILVLSFVIRHTWTFLVIGSAILILGIIRGSQYIAFCRYFDYGMFAEKKEKEIKEKVKES